MKTILVTGSFDLCHSGHAAFLQAAAKFGKVYVGIGSDASITKLKGRPPICNQEERLYRVKAIRWVEDAWINKGMGIMDFAEGFKQDNPIHFDALLVNEDQDFPEKKEFCKIHNMDYMVLHRDTKPGLPTRSSTSLRNIGRVDKYFDALKITLNSIDGNEIDQVIKILLDARKRGATVYICGNGGSGSTASHFAGDLNKLGRIRAISLNDNMALLTAFSNDLDYDHAFSEILSILIQKGDVLFAISGSGNSTNIAHAVRQANGLGNITCGLTGFDGGLLKKMAKYSINVPIKNMQISEDVHLIVCHLIAQALDEIHN